jgi:putative oxidoreductase
MNQHIIARIAIWILSIVMIVFGIQHFTHPRDMLNYVPPYMPGGIVWVYFVGAAFILASVAFIFNKKVKMTGYLLAGLLFIFVITIHIPNYLNAGTMDMQQMALVNILKDTAIAAFALHIAGSADSHGIIY